MKFEVFKIFLGASHPAFSSQFLSTEVLANNESTGIYQRALDYNSWNYSKSLCKCLPIQPALEKFRNGSQFRVRPGLQINSKCSCSEDLAVRGSWVLGVSGLSGGKGVDQRERRGRKKWRTMWQGNSRLLGSSSKRHNFKFFHFFLSP